MVKSKNRHHGLEYIFLNNNEDELWEINYDTGIATNVSSYMKLDSVNTEVTKYSGTIEDFLVKERSCTNVHHIQDVAVRAKFHEIICTFDS
jgi:hypothetical protein